MRIEPRPIGDCPWYLRLLFRAQRRRYGKVLDASLLWARSPRLLAGLSLLYAMLDRKTSPIDPRLRSLVQVRVSQINHCRFCTDLNAATLLDRGVAVDTLEALASWEKSREFDETERLVLAYAEAVVRSDRPVGDDLFAELRRHFDDDAIVELTALIAFQTMSSAFNAALEVPPQGFCLSLRDEPREAGSAGAEGREDP